MGSSGWIHHEQQKHQIGADTERRKRRCSCLPEEDVACCGPDGDAQLLLVEATTTGISRWLEEEGAATDFGLGKPWSDTMQKIERDN